MIVLPRSKVHLWSCSLRPSPAELERRRAVLSDAELARALRFRHEADSIAYVAAHGWLRLVLAAYAGLPPARLRFRETPLGKPSLEPVGEMPPVAFNLSHSGDLAIVAVSAGMPIGIDIERIGSVPDAATGDYLAHAEGAMLSTLPGPLRDEAFTRCWTRKEAYLKATGAGLNTPLTDFAVSLAPSAPARPPSGTATRIGPAGRPARICSISPRLSPISRMRIHTRASTSPCSRTGTSKRRPS